MILLIGDGFPTAEDMVCHDAWCYTQCVTFPVFKLRLDLFNNVDAL